MEINIANNIKTVELLKVELLQKVTDLFGDITAETDCETMTRLTDDTAALLSVVYVLASRLGVDFDSINDAMKLKLKTEIENNHFIERRYGDLSRLFSEL